MLTFSTYFRGIGIVISVGEMVSLDRKAVMTDKKESQKQRRERMEKIGNRRRLLANIRNSNRHDALALILDNQCPVAVSGDWSVFHIELHCEGVVQIVARKVKIEWVVLSSVLLSDEA